MTMEKLGYSLLLLREPSTETQTLGEFTVYEDQIKPIYDCKTMELEVDSNQRRDDAIPAGIYTVILHKSPKFGKCFWIQDVPNRSEVLIHPANYSSQLLGCIAPGLKHIDINNDGLKDVTSSRQAMKDLLYLLPGTFILKIVDAV